MENQLHCTRQFTLPDSPLAYLSDANFDACRCQIIFFRFLLFTQGMNLTLTVIDKINKETGLQLRQSISKAYNQFGQVRTIAKAYTQYLLVVFRAIRIRSNTHLGWVIHVIIVLQSSTETRIVSCAILGQLFNAVIPVGLQRHTRKFYM